MFAKDYEHNEAQFHKKATLYSTAINSFFSVYFNGDVDALIVLIEVLFIDCRQSGRTYRNLSSQGLEFEDRYIVGPITKVLDEMLTNVFAPIKSFAEWTDWIAVMMMIDFLENGKGNPRQRIKYAYNIVDRLIKSPLLGKQYVGSTDAYEISQSKFVTNLIASI